MTAAMPVAPVSAAPRQPSVSASTHSSPSATPLLPPKDVRQEVETEIKSLESGDQVIVAKAAAAIVMLATLQDAVPYLSAAIPHLVPLLHDSSLSVHVRGNACAAITSIMVADPSLYIAAAKTPTLATGLVHFLKGDGERPVDESARLNAAAAAAISVLAQGEEGLGPLREAEADVAIISSLGTATDDMVKEGMVDAVCAFASHVNMRGHLFQKGAVDQLARVLQGASTEVCVRALLALGMLCGSSLEAQVQLASVDGAVETLITLMKSNDHDIKTISRDLFRALTQNEEAKPLVEHGLRNSASV